MEKHLYPHQWLHLTFDVKYWLGKQLGFSAQGERHVIDNQLVEDGFRAEDLAVVTTSKLQEWLGSKEKDFDVLWEMAVNRAKQALEPPKLTMLAPEETKQFSDEYEARKAATIEVASEVAPVVSPKRRVQKKGKK
jgi:hypothetical protein